MTSYRTLTEALADGWTQPDRTADQPITSMPPGDPGQAPTLHGWRRADGAETQSVYIADKRAAGGWTGCYVELYPPDRSEAR